MSITALRPQVPPPVRRVTTVGMAALLVLLALVLLAALTGGNPHPAAASWTAASTAHTASATPLAGDVSRIAWLSHATWTFTGIALLLALAQRSLHDLALAGAGALWAVLFELRTQATKAPEATSLATSAGLQIVLIGALGLSLWYGLRLLRRSGLRPHPLPLTRLLTLSGLAALGLGLTGVLKQPVYWILPISCVLACCGALVRMVDMGRRPGSLLRPSLAAWLLALSVAWLIAAGCHELWLEAAEGPPSTEQLSEAWIVTRSAIVLVLVCALGLRLDQLARMLRQLGGSHGHWRKRLRDVQRELAQTRERVALAERTDALQSRRDHLLRELHDELGHRLLAALDTLQPTDDPAVRRDAHRLLDGSLVELRLAYDALGTVPRPLTEALHRLQQQLAPLLEEAGMSLRCAVEGPAQTLVLNQAETLQLLRIIRGAMGTTLHRAATHGGLEGLCKWWVDVVEGETGRHLRLRLSDEPSDLPSQPAARLGAEWHRLQRQATSLGAQLALETQAGPGRLGWAIELVMPLAGR